MTVGGEFSVLRRVWQGTTYDEIFPPLAGEAVNVPRLTFPFTFRGPLKLDLLCYVVVELHN